MIAAVDAHYAGHSASVASVTFAVWTDAEPVEEAVERVDGVEDYKPGEFWRRELPCILAVLGRLKAKPSTIVVDGYVWLDRGRKGLGAHLFGALEGRVAVVGVAKGAFRGASESVTVRRGSSQRPLYVTSIGVDPSIAAAAVASMHGSHRIPTLLKRVDQLARQDFPRGITRDSK